MIGIHDWKCRDLVTTKQFWLEVFQMSKFRKKKLQIYRELARDLDMGYSRIAPLKVVDNYPRYDWSKFVEYQLTLK